MAKTTNYDREPWENLANAVVHKAFDDYVSALKMIKRYQYPMDEIEKNKLLHYKSEAESCEKFFKSKRFKLFTSVSGEFLINEAKKKVYNT